MFKTTLASLATAAFSFSLLAPVTLAIGDDPAYGVHPWDVRPRRHYEVGRGSETYFSDYYYDTHPDRVRAFSLHPYTRERFYAPPVDTGIHRYTQFYHPSVRYKIEEAYVPRPHKLATCTNYSYGLPNYRVPPYDYKCEN